MGLLTDNSVQFPINLDEFKRVKRHSKKKMNNLEKSFQNIEKP